MTTQLTTGRVDDGTGLQGRVTPPLGAVEEFPVVPRGDKADLLAVRFMRHLDAELAGHGPNTDLGQSPQRKTGPGQGRLIECPEEIALVLAVVTSPKEVDLSVIASSPSNPGIVTCGDKGGIETVRRLQERGESNALVAANTGVRSSAAEIFRTEVFDDMAAEIDFHVERAMGYTELLASDPGVLEGFDGAAALFVDLRAFSLSKTEVSHRHTDDIVTLPGEDGRGNGAVDPAAHGDHDLILQGRIRLHGPHRPEWKRPFRSSCTPMDRYVPRRLR
jgi:hypothetical protein